MGKVAEVLTIKPPAHTDVNRITNKKQLKEPSCNSKQTRLVQQATTTATNKQHIKSERHKGQQQNKHTHTQKTSLTRHDACKTPGIVFDQSLFQRSPSDAMCSHQHQNAPLKRCHTPHLFVTLYVCCIKICKSANKRYRV